MTLPLSAEPYDECSDNDAQLYSTFLAAKVPSLLLNVTFFVQYECNLRQSH